MKKIALICCGMFIIVTCVRAQSPAPSIMHSRDFFMVQLSYDSWAGAPDSIHTGGISRGVNVAFMYDFPIKEGSHFSVAPGLGVSSSNIFFDDQRPLIGEPRTTLNFPRDTIYKRFKLATAFLEIPIEFRYRQFSDNANKGWKVGVGVKLGTLMSVHTKGKMVTGGKRTDKVTDKAYFTPWRMAATARIGWGNLSAFTSYTLTPLLKTAAGPKINPYSIGIGLSGL